MACSHEHNCACTEDCPSSCSLYKHIDISKVSALNESHKDAVKSVFKPWEKRLTPDEDLLESIEEDPELLIYVPFTADVKIQKILILGGAGETSPSKLRVFTNKMGMDFNDAQSTKAVQEWDLVDNAEEVVEYQTRYTKFQAIANVTLHLSGNSECCKKIQIRYIGFKGEATQFKRDAIATVVYELKPNPLDHKGRVKFHGGTTEV